MSGEMALAIGIGIVVPLLAFIILGILYAAGVFGKPKKADQ